MRKGLRKASNRWKSSTWWNSLRFYAYA